MKTELSRRELFMLSAGAAMSASLGATAASPTFPHPVIEANDNAVAEDMRAQVLDPTHRFRGGIPDSRELYSARNAGRFIQKAVAAYCCEESKYHNVAEVAERIQHAIAFLENEQNSDGNIDLMTTNYNSPPDTGFVVHTVANAANIARRYKADKLVDSFETFLTEAGRGMAKGGIHTPNHRWVVSAAMAQINELYPDKALVDRIDAWLAEGIDIDDEGQFTERSTGGYNATCDEAFVLMAHKLNRPELLEPVRKNLDAMAYLIHPNGEVVTEFSNRQDRNTHANMERYWFPLRTMAIIDSNGLYTSMLKPIEPHAMELPLLMEYPELNAPLPTPTPIPDNYEIELPRSGITRIRRGKSSATIIHRRNSRWFSLHHGDAVINAVRFASAFFSDGQFVPKEFEKVDNEFRFYYATEGRYYQPFSDPKYLPVPQEKYGAWRRQREVSEVSTLNNEGRIRETENGFAVTISVTGSEGMPLSIEINLRPDVQLSGVIPLSDDRYLLKEGMATCTVGNNVIRFGPGRAEHRYVQIRGAEDKLSGPSVYLTGYTPFETTIEFECTSA